MKGNGTTPAPRIMRERLAQLEACYEASRRETIAGVPAMNDTLHDAWQEKLQQARADLRVSIRAHDRAERITVRRKR